jgi:hypothetical protein
MERKSNVSVRTGGGVIELREGMSIAVVGYLCCVTVMMIEANQTTLAEVLQPVSNQG